jgi:hypothetical protein
MRGHEHGLRPSWLLLLLLLVVGGFACLAFIYCCGFCRKHASLMDKPIAQVIPEQGDVQTASFKDNIQHRLLLPCYHILHCCYPSWAEAPQPYKLAHRTEVLNGPAVGAVTGWLGLDLGPLPPRLASCIYLPCKRGIERVFVFGVRNACTVHPSMAPTPYPRPRPQ